jgi:hypothetical protein
VKREKVPCGKEDQPGLQIRQTAIVNAGATQKGWPAMWEWCCDVGGWILFGLVLIGYVGLTCVMAGLFDDPLSSLWRRHLE